MNNYTESIIGEPAESIKIQWAINKYTENRRGLDLGCGGRKIKGSIGIDIRKGPHIDYVGDVTKGLANVLGYRRKRRFDYIFSSHLLEDFNEEMQIFLVKDWIDHLKPQGMLLIYGPKKGAYTGCNLAHKREFTKEILTDLFNVCGLNIIDYWDDSIASPGVGYSILITGRKE